MKRNLYQPITLSWAIAQDTYKNTVLLGQKTKSPPRILAAMLLVTWIASVAWPSASADTSAAYSHDSTTGVTYPDWMAGLPDEMHLAQISIPGTHDSGASVNGGDLAVAQSMDFATQLEAGIRMWDVRLDSDPLGLFPGVLFVFHGPILQGGFAEVLTAATAFLQAHPSETILMRIREENGYDATFSHDVLNYLNQQDNVIFPPTDELESSTSKWANPALADLRGKIYIWEDSWQGEPQDNTGKSEPTFFWWSSSPIMNVQDDYNVGSNWDLAVKWGEIKLQLANAWTSILPFRPAAANATLPIIVNFLSASCSSGCVYPYFIASGKSSPETDAPQLLTGYTRGVIDTCADYPTYCIDEYPSVDCAAGTCSVEFLGSNLLMMEKLNESPTQPVGITMADFPGAGLIQSIIAKNLMLLNCPSDISVSTGPDASSCGQTASWVPPTVSVNVAGVSMTSDHLPGDTFPVGTTPVTYTAKDSLGNTASCTFNVTVTDNTAPAISGCPGDITAYTGVQATTCDQQVRWTEPQARGLCSPASLTSNYRSGDRFPVGTTVVTYTAKDSNGNSAQCSFNVIVVDNTPPVFSACPSDITVYTGPSRTTCDQVATWTAPTATDNCTDAAHLLVSGDHQPGETFPVGMTKVTYTAKDANGNSAQCSFNVIVVDNTPPVFSACPSDITVYTGPGRTTCDQVATWTAPTAADNCTDAAHLLVSGDHQPGETFPVGMTKVTYTARDSNGNSADCSFNVVVIDNTPPLIACPPASTPYVTVNAVNSSGATVNYPLLSVGDNCGTPTVKYSAAPGSAFPIGTTSVACVAVDGSGNMSTCTFTIYVESASEQIADLIGGVNAASSVSSSIRHALIVKLDAAQADLSQMDTADACSSLQAFISLTQAQIDKKITPASIGTSFISDATRIRAVLGCL
jgi:hypothetical protein